MKEMIEEYGGFVVSVILGFVLIGIIGALLSSGEGSLSEFVKTMFENLGAHSLQETGS